MAKDGGGLEALLVDLVGELVEAGFSQDVVEGGLEVDARGEAANAGIEGSGGTEVVEVAEEALDVVGEERRVRRGEPVAHGVGQGPEDDVVVEGELVAVRVGAEWGELPAHAADHVSAEGAADGWGDIIAGDLAPVGRDGKRAGAGACLGGRDGVDAHGVAGERAEEPVSAGDRQAEELEAAGANVADGPAEGEAVGVGDAAAGYIVKRWKAQVVRGRWIHEVAVGRRGVGVASVVRFVRRRAAGVSCNPAASNMEVWRMWCKAV